MNSNLNNDRSCLGAAQRAAGWQAGWGSSPDLRGPAATVAGGVFEPQGGQGREMRWDEKGP